MFSVYVACVCRQVLVAVRSGQTTRFNRLSMHGEGLFHHSAETGLGNGDFQFIVDDKEIYWLDTEHQTISFMDFDGIRLHSKHSLTFTILLPINLNRFHEPHICEQHWRAHLDGDSRWRCLLDHCSIRCYPLGAQTNTGQCQTAGHYSSPFHDKLGPNAIVGYHSEYDRRSHLPANGLTVLAHLRATRPECNRLRLSEWNGFQGLSQRDLYWSRELWFSVSHIVLSIQQKQDEEFV